MRQTVNLFVGRDVAGVSRDVMSYVFKNGEEESRNYVHTRNVSCDEEDGVRVTEVVQFFPEDGVGRGATVLPEVSFVEDGPNSKIIRTSNPLVLADFFKGLFSKYVTLEYAGAAAKLLVCFYVLLDDDKGVETVSQMAQSASADPANDVFVVGLSADYRAMLSKTDINAEEKVERHKAEVRNLESLAAAFAPAGSEQGRRVRLLILQNVNMSGFSLNFDRATLCSVVGEYVLACAEHFDELYPVAAMVEVPELSSFGVASVGVDRLYFVNYLLRRAYVHVLEREGVCQEKVDVNMARNRTQSLIGDKTRLFSGFWNDVIRRKLTERKAETQIVSEAAPELDKLVESAREECLSFLKAPEAEMSLPCKQAALAVMMGEDDGLLEGDLYEPNTTTADDMAGECLELFVSEDNKAGEKRVLHTPKDERGMVFVPLREIKNLRNQIRQTTVNIRRQEEKLSDLAKLIHLSGESGKRLTKDGFRFGGVEYRLMPVAEEKPLEETYEPTAGEKPKAVDMRGAFPPAKNQGSIGSCTAFACVAIIEHMMRVRGQKEVELSERFVYYNARVEEGLGQEGSSFYKAIGGMAEKGVCSETACPYVEGSMDEEPAGEAFEEAAQLRVLSAKNVRVKHEDIVSALSEGYPVAISLNLYDSFGDCYGGFVCQPSRQEVESKDKGRHAMLICGYNDERKVYIVRNSWGVGFGDKGYCYIPYSYVDSPMFNNGAYIVCALSGDMKETPVASPKQADTKLAFSFGEMDNNINYVLTRILCDEEKSRLERLKKRYAVLSTDYTRQYESLSVSTRRDEILNQSIARLSDAIMAVNQKKFEVEHEEHTLMANIKESNKRNRLVFVSLTALTLAIGLALMGILGPMRWAGWAVTGLSGVLLLATLYVFADGKRRLRAEKERYKERLSECNQRLNNLTEEVKEKKLKFHIAGMLIERIGKLKLNLAEKYQFLKSFVVNLRTWHDEEKTALDKMSLSEKHQFRTLLDNKVLDAYFEKHKEELTSGVHPYEQLDKYDNLSDEAIVRFREEFKNSVENQLDKVFNDFSVVRYVTGLQHYAFMPDPQEKLKDAIPGMERLGVPFVGLTAPAACGMTFVACYGNAEEKGELERSTNAMLAQMPNYATSKNKQRVVLLQLVDTTISQLKW